jgi:hypothetical protein
MKINEIAEKYKNHTGDFHCQVMTLRSHLTKD